MSEYGSESPRMVLYIGRGGYMRCGEFMYFKNSDDGEHILVKSNPGGSIPNTSVKESNKLSPDDACHRYNRLLERAEAADEQISDLQRENQQLRDTLTSTDAERRFWENEVAMIQDSVVNGEEEEDV